MNKTRRKRDNYVKRAFFSFCRRVAQRRRRQRRWYSRSMSCALVCESNEWIAGARSRNTFDNHKTLCKLQALRQRYRHYDDHHHRERKCVRMDRTLKNHCKVNFMACSMVFASPPFLSFGSAFFAVSRAPFTSERECILLPPTPMMIARQTGDMPHFMIEQ